MQSKLRKNLALLASCLAFIIVILDVSVVNVALEKLHSDFQGTLSTLEWVVNGYTLTFAAFLLTSGALSDRYGPKRIFILGFILFAVASLFCGLANDLPTLVVFRFLQGIGAALVVPTSLAIINHTFTDKDERTKAISLWAAAGGMALALGPVFGGLLISLINWRAIFFVNMPIAIVGVALAYFYTVNTLPSKKRVIDVAGLVLNALTLGGFTIVIIQANESGWLSPEVLAGLVIGIVSLILFIIVEKRHSDPMLPLGLFSNSHFTSSALIGVLVNFSFYGLIFLFSLFFQYAWNYSALETGLAFLPMTGAIMIANLMSAKMIVNLGYRSVLFIGGIIATGGYLCIIPFMGSGNFSYILLQFVAAGIGIGLMVPAMTNAMINSVDSDYIGVASGVLNASRQVGGLLGVATMGLIVGGVSSDHFVSGLSSALALASLSLVIALILSTLGLRAVTASTCE
ncbi:DHA2 family methylenomycin A resistance protein-like MFS transporter [Sinobacterium caligoides]|uniref:DHA2 family methylenomycin A resistance protein-like MFS transporter n=1 Tax=Sinobacterium caligoides TaxID=933926 RepID=A0A3N2DPQ2_9GAMM|nr:MFS transporter [Sinobacterium caligoides]ROS01777.1 DHA2 family methylenomycin A resistance protein-like MFS transporter [Sinobacterium caligoides]